MVTFCLIDYVTKKKVNTLNVNSTLLKHTVYGQTVDFKCTTLTITLENFKYSPEKKGEIKTQKRSYLESGESFSEID